MRGVDLDFSRQLFIINNLLTKIRHLESICGGALIHDVRVYLHILENWKDNLEKSSSSLSEFRMLIPNSGEFFNPSQDYIDNYFTNLFNKIEIFLENNIKQ